MYLLSAQPGDAQAGVNKGNAGETKSMKGYMKKMFLGLSLMALLAGCASHKSDNGMGGTSDQYNQSEQSNTSSSSDQFHNNATQGTGTSTPTNSTTGPGMSQ